MAFHNFTAPVWEIFAGNLLFLLCSVCYLSWWVVSFRPGAPHSPIGTVCITAAFVTGIAAIVLMSVGTNALAQSSKGLPVRFVWIGAAALYLLLLLVTVVIFHRQVTSELLIIHLWAAMELSAIVVLSGTGRLAPWGSIVLTALVGAAIVVGLICYVLYYRLEGMSAYRDGMVPLVTDAAVMVAFLAMLAFS